MNLIEFLASQTTESHKTNGSPFKTLEPFSHGLRPSGPESRDSTQTLICLREGLTSRGSPGAVPTPKITRIRESVFYLLDWGQQNEEELVQSVLTHRKGALYKFTHRVAAMLGKQVNPETVARRIREWKTESR